MVATMVASAAGRVIVAGRSAEATADRRRRNRRIHELRAAGWSLATIARDVGITKTRVIQILAVPVTRDAITAAEAAAHEELARVLTVVADGRRRAIVLERQLRRLEEERESARIDALLGLPRPGG